jgi:hypothetical protein
MAIPSSRQSEIYTTESIVLEIRELRRDLALRTPQVLNRVEAARYLRISTRQLDILAKSEAVRSSRIGGSVRYQRQWLDDYLEENALGGPKPGRADEILNEQ